MIDEATAHKICRILDEELDSEFAFDPMVEDAFVRYVTSHPHVEWRLFITRGIKFRTKPRGDHWYVDCYPEEERRELLAAIAKANQRLDRLQFEVEKRLER